MMKLSQVLDLDLEFFKDNERNHRVRLASLAEIEEQTFIGRPIKVPPDSCVYVAVRQIMPGVLRRVFVVAGATLPTDLTEDQANGLFLYLAAVQTVRDAA